MKSVGKHHSSSVRRSLPQITQIYTDIGCVRKNTNHTNAAQEKSVTIRGICGKTFSQEKSVRICEIRGTTSLKQHAEESPTDYADLHGYWVRRRRTRITRMQHKKISVTIREIYGKTSLKLRAEESPTDYADLHGYWMRAEEYESHECSTRKIRDNP